jgi:predicted GH43/DUF377 family glycosyl hydrolase
MTQRRSLFTSCLFMSMTAAIAAATTPSHAPSEDPLTGYLLVYFTDPTHSVHLALSEDGYTFTALNDGKPVMDGRDLAEQKGIRDPHIMRGPDGMFYMVMTDLHIFAQRDGLRETEWERPGDDYGWGNNRAIVMMKSSDLIEWTRSNFRIDQAFPGIGDVGAFWAPQTIYDEEMGKLMVYFTMRIRNGHNRLYYAYADDAFTRLETKPELLFEYPRDISYIDADITRVGDRFHMFYVPHDDGGPQIRQAISDRIHSGYRFDPARVDAERVASEAPNLWKRLGTDTYVLMYDVYGIRPHNFGFSETTDFKTFTGIGRFNDGGPMKATNFSSPKHGAVVHLTREEMKRLATHWNLAP